MKNLKLLENYRDDHRLRSAFFAFIPEVFPSADFKEWHSKGYWGNNYIPYSFVNDGKIISNVSVSRMKILIKGEQVNGFQFGTVGTLPEYRKRGLSRELMQIVLEKYENDADIFFLFANDSVLEFYPKFGFNRIHEVIYIAENSIPDSNYSARQLDIQNPSDLQIITKLLADRMVITELFGALDYEFITMWHIINVYPFNLFYLEDEDIIFIVTHDKDKIHIWDVIYRKPFNFKSALAKVIGHDSVSSISYYFSPDKLNYEYNRTIASYDSPLFIRGDFPLSNQKFKFPATAQT